MRLLIAVDGSHHAMAAVSAVARRHWSQPTEVKLLYVAPHRISSARAQEIDRAFAEAESILTLDRPWFTVSHDVAHGSVREAVLHVAAAWQADLIVVGCRGHSLLEDLLLGSVSQSIIEQARCPVVVAREVQPNAIGNVLVPVDDSPSSAAAVEWLATQSWANGLTIALVSVAHNPEPKVGMQSVQKASETMMEWETERGLLDVALRYWSDFLRERLPNSTIHHGVADGDPREMIARAANTWPADCVVMGSSGRKGFAKLLLGSVSQNVAANAKCSVEIVRGVPSLHYHHVHALIEKHRLESPLNIEPSQQKFGSTVSSSPIFFLH